MEIVTGSTGQVHVTSIDDAVRNGNPGYLNSRVVLTFLENFAYTIVTNNQVKIGSGYGMNQGRIFKIDEGEFDMVTIESGSQGYKRADLIVARYTMNTQSGFEDISLVAIRGTSGTTYTDPSYTVGNINNGATLDDMPLYRVKINGLVIESVERMFTLVPDGARLGQLEKKVNDHMTYFNKINVRTNLASEGAPLLKDGGSTGNIRPGVEGTLPASHGGTGQTTLKNAGNSILNSLDENNTNPTNDTYFIGSTAGVSGFQKKKISTIWNYILGKIRTQLGLTNDVVPISHGGTGKTSVGNSKILVGSNGAFVEKTLSTTLAEASNDKIPTTKAVADELETRGYGDMTKATFCNANTTVIAVTHGGTGQTTAAGIRNSLGLGNTTGAVPIANGGTGATTAAGALSNLGITNNYYTKADTLEAVRVNFIDAGRDIIGQLNTLQGKFNNYYTKADTLEAVRVNFIDAGRDIIGQLNNKMPKVGGTFTGNISVDRGGSSTTEGWSRIYLGNNKANGTAGNQTGIVSMYSANGKRVDLAPNASATEGTIRLPAGTGTLALTSQFNNYYTKADTLEAVRTNYIDGGYDISGQLNSKMPKSGGTFTNNVYFNNMAQVFGDRLILGTTASRGKLRIYGSKSTATYGDLTESAVTISANRTYSVPNKSGIIQVSDPSSRRIKENIHDMTEERAKKLLDLDVVNFDYIGEFGGGLKDQSGVIAEDAVKVIPEAVIIPEKYDASKPVDDSTNPAPSVDYRQYIPYLIKMVQMQQKEIEELKAALNK